MILFKDNLEFPVGSFSCTVGASLQCHYLPLNIIPLAFPALSCSSVLYRRTETLSTVLSLNSKFHSSNIYYLLHKGNEWLLLPLPEMLSTLHTFHSLAPPSGPFSHRFDATVFKELFKNQSFCTSTACSKCSLLENKYSLRVATTSSPFLSPTHRKYAPSKQM